MPVGKTHAVRRKGGSWASPRPIRNGLAAPRQSIMNLASTGSQQHAHFTLRICSKTKYLHADFASFPAERVAPWWSFICAGLLVDVIVQKT